MRYLLDTHAFLWLASDDPRLSERVRTTFLDPAHECWLSTASIWEMAIKISLKKLVVDTPLKTIVSDGLRNGLNLLDVGREHALRVETLPFYHRDPFDRLLIAQALVENVEVLSRDPVFDDYSVARIW